MNLRYSIDPADTDGGTTAALIEQEADDFTTAARAAGRRMFITDDPDYPDREAATLRAQGFAEGAVWAAAQEPTDADVEAAAEAAFLSTGPAVANGFLSAWADADEYQRARWRTRARAALSAARAARTQS